MCVESVCVCLCVWAAEEGEGVICLLLLISHDFPVLTTLQNASGLASATGNLFLSYVTHVVIIRQQSWMIFSQEGKTPILRLSHFIAAN